MNKSMRYLIFVLLIVGLGYAIYMLMAKKTTGVETVVTEEVKTEQVPATTDGKVADATTDGQATEQTVAQADVQTTDVQQETAVAVEGDVQAQQETAK